MPNTREGTGYDFASLAVSIKAWGRALGFQQVGIADTDLSNAETRLVAWLGKGWHGEMDYMARHGTRRTRPAELVPGTLRVIACRMNYASSLGEGWGELADGERAYIARYARGRDYHKLLRSRLQDLTERIAAEVGTIGAGGHSPPAPRIEAGGHSPPAPRIEAGGHSPPAPPGGFRVFTDSAPVMEVELATKAGLGWRGKHTLLLTREAGSYFFLGEIYTDLPLPVDTPVGNHCGSCTKCIEVCPTQAIRGPYSLDARRCISYLTIELKGSIPAELRPLIGNRVYGCDDCQLACPWNGFAQVTDEPDFAVRNGLDAARLVDLFGWNKAEFGARMAGSAIRRIGYERWLRNLAVGLGNAPRTDGIVAALQARADHPSALVREHVAWALQQQADHKV